MWLIFFKIVNSKIMKDFKTKEHKMRFRHHNYTNMVHQLIQRITMILCFCKEKKANKKLSPIVCNVDALF